MQMHPTLLDVKTVSACCPACLFVCLFVCLSVCLFVCLSVCLFMPMQGMVFNKLLF